MEITKIFSLFILTLLLTRLIHSNFTLDLYLFFKILLTAALYFYPYKTQANSIPSVVQSPKQLKIPDSSPNQSKKFSFSHLTDLPIRKLDFDQIENSPILLKDPINMTEKTPSPTIVHNISLSKHEKKDKNPFMPSTAPKFPTLQDVLKKSKSESQKINKKYQDYAQNMIFEYQNFVENSEPVIEADKKPAVHVKGSLNMLPVILEKNESETGFEFCPLEHKSIENSEKAEKIEMGLAFDPKPNAGKPFAMSGLEMQIKNLNDESVNKNVNVPPHTVLPVHRVKPYATQVPILSNQTEFNPIPNDKNQVIQTSAMLGVDKTRGNDLKFSEKPKENGSNVNGLSTVQKNDFEMRMQGFNAIGSTKNNDLNGDTNKNHSFFVGGLTKVEQISNLSANATYLKGTVPLVNNHIANVNNLSGQIPQYSNHFANGTNQSVNINPFANATSFNSQTHNSINNPFANANNLDTKLSQTSNPFSNANNLDTKLSQTSNPFSNANSLDTKLSQTSNPFSNATNFSIKPNNLSSQVNPINNSNSYNTQSYHITNSLSSSTSSNPQHPKSLNPFANTTEVNNSLNPFKTDTNSFNPKPVGNIPEYRPTVNHNNPFSAAYPSVPVSNFSISSPMSNPFTPKTNFAVQSSIPQANIYSTPPASISNTLSAYPASSQIPSSLTMNSNLHPGFSNPSSNSLNNFSMNSGFNTKNKLDTLTLSSYKTLRGQISACDNSQKLIIEELLYALKIHYVDMSTQEIENLHERILLGFKRVTEDKQVLIAVSFTVYLVEFYLENCNNDSKITLTYADYFIRLYNKLSLSISGILNLLEFEIKSLHEIFSPRIFSQNEATDSWQLLDLKRIYEGGILQKQITNEIKSVENLSVLLTMFYLKHNPDTIFNLLSQLSNYPVPRQWLPMVVGILIVFPIIKTSQLAGKIIPIIEVHKLKLLNIPKICKELYFIFEISRFNENYNKIFGF